MLAITFEILLICDNTWCEPRNLYWLINPVSQCNRCWKVFCQSERKFLRRSAREKCVPAAFRSLFQRIMCAARWICRMLFPRGVASCLSAAHPDIHQSRTFWMRDHPLHWLRDFFPVLWAVRRHTCDSWVELHSYGHASYRIYRYRDGK